MRAGPDIGVTLGDPAGIGPEIVVAALSAWGAEDRARVVVFGDVGVLARAARSVGLPLPAVEIEAVTTLDETQARPGHPDAEAGRAQVAYLEAGVTAALAGRVGGLVTAPIHKAAARAAGFSFPGHTEFLAAHAGVTEHAMMMCGRRLRVALVTTHVGLAAVPSLLTPDAIASTAALLVRALHDDLGIDRPRVAVAGLNPHAGEQGLFGDEEGRVVVPGVQRASERLAAELPGAVVRGPEVPDVVFRAASEGAWDGVVALYHDQGLIPVKLLEFDQAVNVTLGLPFVRTSPDHGVAYDLAGTGRARPHSFSAALDLARTMMDRRRHSR
jgi:4-hydroxythreonine-4-phosphate dehydrogenase